MSKPLVRVIFKLRSVLDPNETQKTFVLDIPTAGECEVILDRDEMGVPFIAESQCNPNDDWMQAVEHARDATAELQDKAVRLEIATRRLQSELFNLAKLVG